MEERNRVREEFQSTVRFEAPFWVLVLERWSAGRYGTARQVLGTSEPGSAEVRAALDRIDFLRLEWAEVQCRELRREISPKRQAREIAASTKVSEFRHTYSRSHEVLKAFQEKSQGLAAARHKLEVQEREEAIRLKRIQRRKRRHRGR